jgi:hypothetical protein
MFAHVQAVTDDNVSNDIITIMSIKSMGFIDARQQRCKRANTK